jgi:hypothetical protein
MKMKMHVIQFVSIVNWIQTKLSENSAAKKKSSVSSLKLILESMSGSFSTGHLSKIDISDASKQLNHHTRQVDAHKHRYFQHWRLFVEIGEQSWK